MTSEIATGESNRLAGETSPYLLQHATNPVDWYPWGEEAFARALAEDRPVLLSVGYSSCHWCHVMAHESFENPETAALMNQWFVNVKVDREERPDIDGVYMNVVQALTGRGGWPMTVFLTPDARPLYAGTYFPAQDGHGLPAFPRVLEAIHNAWMTERERLLTSAEGITEHLRAAARRAGGEALDFSPEITARALETFHVAFDADWGGFGSAPKFPAPSNLEFLLAHYARAPQGDAALGMAPTTLVRMAQGGMYDHLGGGFSRYSVDERWLVPHFEKMLYDNAQLARVYLHAYQLTHDDFFARVARETLDYLVRDMRDGAGGFHAAEDADSEGIEGKFYVWTPAEIREVLGDDAAVVGAWYGVTDEGNFRDPHHPEFGSRTVLSTWHDPAQLAARFGITVEELFAKVEAAKPRLLEARSQRVRPGLDDKVLTSWNGLALAAFAEAARVLGDDGYRRVALENAAFLRRELWHDGRLLHTWKGGSARVQGMLEDYAYLGLGLVELFKATGDLAHLEWARSLFDVIETHFADPAGGFFETADDGEALLIRERSFFDQATPSGNSAAALLAMWLGRYYGRADREELAIKTVLLAGAHLAQAPTGFGAALQVLEFALAPHLELVISGEPGAREPLEREAASFYLPWHAIAPTETGEGLPMFEGREPEDTARAYLCQNMSCGMPATTPSELASQLTPRDDGGLFAPSLRG